MENRIQVQIHIGPSKNIESEKTLFPKTILGPKDQSLDEPLKPLSPNNLLIICFSWAQEILDALRI